LDSLGALKIFVEVAQVRSFVDAGRRLGISASAVGKAIARLEERLAARLFHRSTRSVALTAEGALFLDRCRRILAEMEAAEQELSEAGRIVRGPLRISLPAWGDPLTPMLGAFMRAYPEVRMEIDFTDRLVDVIEEGFDLAIRTGAAGDSGLMSRTLGAFRHVLAASPDYLKRRGRPTAPEDLAAHACLHHRHPVTGKLELWPLMRDGAELALDLPIAAIASSVEARVQLIEMGLGIACVPFLSVRRQLADGRLVSLLEDSLLDVGTYRILWPANRNLSRNVRAFVDFVVAHGLPDRQARVAVSSPSRRARRTGETGRRG
jgi:DNA-binding transcriptional LysR family regulator